jgi:UDP-N-acetylmuramoylalanine--D-glutamate ligase
LDYFRAFGADQSGVTEGEIVVQLADKQVIVVGLGRSGVAAARLCLSQGARVIGTDANPLSQLTAAAQDLPITFAAGGHTGVDFESADLVVVSPGVPSIPELARAEQAGVEVIGELEFAARFCTNPIIAIGGTNGKSTVTTLLAAMFAAGDYRVFSGGNLGSPLSEAALSSWDILAVEVSSFQLERAPSFHPRVSILLNITEDHLDRYANFEDYANAKGNAFLCQTAQDFAVIPANDPECERQATRGRAQIVTFGTGADYLIRSRSIIEAASGELFGFESSRLFGLHNAQNIAACIAAARAMNLDRSAIERALSEYVPLPHRMAYVAEIAGVRFYDDSKGTNVGASVTALKGLEENRGVLIAGGRDKLGDYAPLVDALQKKGRALVVLGEAAERIATAARGVVPTSRVANLQEAVETAMNHALPGDAVLLSPACSSFDMFSGYAERGDQFVAAVRRLQRPKESTSCE